MKIPKSLLALGLCLVAYSCAHEAPTTSKEQNQTHAPATIDEQAHAYTQLIRDLMLKPTDQNKPTQGFRSQELSDSLSVYENLSDKEKTLLQEISNLSLEFSPEESNSHIVLPHEVRDSLISLCELSLDPDHERYSRAVRSYEHSDIYQSYSPAIKDRIQLRLKMISYMREDMIDLYHQSLYGKSSFRMSPGDRMIWSEAMKQLNPCQREVMLQVQLEALGAMISGPSIVGSIFYIKSIASLIKEYSDCDKEKLNELKHLKCQIKSGDGPHQRRPDPKSNPQPRNGRPELPPHLERKKYEDNPGPPPPPGKPENPKKSAPTPPPGKPGKPVRPS